MYECSLSTNNNKKLSLWKTVKCNIAQCVIIVHIQRICTCSLFGVVILIVFLL